ncbi:SDR family NAD(P)-dependent oxidoreductase [Nocardioides mangrovi]|uniref:SDR family NAD(P)-dependent oxidoreductase n=1 Tax=Nocardioides mangrovi TaxID=2874580 RepID=A0ABS7U7D0_9ACTN|nr:SDR family NAD(P)-dependent oxidoreductase [Nocardioides mangrovi]MBZ5736893.1 SDR family NAD(P)-dependent oxidoreductase [Nocardioides mangrovi]
MTAPGGVVVTGAARGIGRASVVQLAGRGLHTFAGVRDEADAAALSTIDGAVTPLPLDVTDADQVHLAAELVREELGGRPLHGVVNNAGQMLSGPWEYVPAADLQRLVDVNVVGPLRVVQAFLPLLRESRGTVVNIGSTSARMPGRFVGPYAASKAALEALSSSLRLELADAGVSVSVIEPGAVATGLWEHERDAHAHWAAALPADGRDHYGRRAASRGTKLADVGVGGLGPEEVAAVVADAVTSSRPRPRYVVGGRARTLVLLGRVLPERAVVRLRS